MSLSTIFEMFVLSNMLFGEMLLGSDHQGAINRFFEAYNVRSYNKCGFHIIANYYGTPADEFNVKGVLQVRPPNDTFVVSPSGKFRIHFDTTDINGNQPFLYDPDGNIIPNSTYAFIDSVENTCDYVYHVEVDSLGFPPPPSDSGAGGGNEYDIYVQSLPAGEYGYTDYNPSQPLINRINPTYAAWSVIRNEFQSTYTKGIPAMEVTIAHEFHHGIQVGNYGLWQQKDLWFYELTSTWMEQVVYPEVKDYYQYLIYFFDNVDRPFDDYQQYNYAGYERCIFGIFVQYEYGTSMMKKIWEKMAHEPPIPAIEDAFTAAGDDPSSVFQLFAQLNYFTNYRTQIASQFNITPYPLGEDYPLVKISMSDTLSGSGVSFPDSAMRLTEHFYQIYYNSDTFGLTVVNNNFSAAINDDKESFPFLAGISFGGQNCVEQLANGYCLFFAAANHNDWGIIPFISNQAFAEKNNGAYPQPFNPLLFLQPLKIPYPFSDTNDVTLSIFSISGTLVRTENSAPLSFLRGRCVTWDGKDSRGKIVSTGIYIYVLTNRSKTVLGKIAVVKN
ncbi:MAG TPA: MXAN_6640 family putative metalloprotease [Candidatus Acidoferrales bacterium]|nr:MXAN_6640 family putative metalloprotease [Candidatus Acidoferrales bacterium]